MNARTQPLTPTSSYSGETLVGDESPPSPWSPRYSVASTLVDELGHGPDVGSADPATSLLAVRAWLRSSSAGHSPSEALRPDDSGVHTDTADVSPSSPGAEEEQRENPLTPASSTSDSTLVGSPTDSWSSGQATIHSSAEDDLIEAVRSHRLEQVEVLCHAGVSLSAANSEVLYDACLHGTQMIGTLAYNPAHNFAGRVANAYRDYIFHAVLRTPARDFYQDNTAYQQPGRVRKMDVVCDLLTRGVDLSLRDRIGDTVLHTVCGDLGPPDLDNETEGYPFLKLFLGRGDDGHGEGVRGACMSLINAQNSGWINGEGQQQIFWHTPLGVAILYNNLACARLLLENGADPNIPGEWGEPPVYFAVRNDSLAAVHLLLDAGAKVTAQTYLQIRSSQVEAALRSRGRAG
ncbi:hypothetical protein CABS01_16967 [Colletotrichum abscissum]|uniref:uncharacterized protein n=1 Tax=Colletotrichum abscissum TaxID=1671311 RepID=UPI0027D4DDB7|nr:uncharacterized protein CABS01_16967 [Colletotrichum abscissum]KAK1502258.1 hypothetical protein CABS01_16967 [Colletotrichum abscissum]